MVFPFFYSEELWILAEVTLKASYFRFWTCFDAKAAVEVCIMKSKLVFLSMIFEYTRHDVLIVTVVNQEEI